MKLKKIFALMLCVIMLLAVPVNAETQTAIDEIMATENYQKTKEFVDSGLVYDLGLYSAEEAVHVIELKNPDFAELCSDPQTVTSLAVLISQETDDFLKDLIGLWYNNLLTRNSVSISSTDSSDYESYTLTLPGGKTIAAKRYTGTSTPGTYTGASNYSSAVLLNPSSYSYNCHSYAWYLHGDISSHYPQLCFDNHNGFTASPTCATQVYTPRVGDIVTYTDEFDFYIDAQHSAIITSVSAGTGVDQIVVSSKWGCYGVYSHILSDCPYYTDTTQGTTHYQTEVRFYRLSHQYVLSGNYYYCKCCGYKNPIIVTSE